LGAIHLYSLADALNPEAAQRAAYLFPIPIATPYGPRTAHLKVCRRPGSNRVDPENMRLSLLLDLPALGEMVINLNVFEQNLSGQILSGRQQTHRLVELDLSRLRKGLSGLGYRIDSLTCDLLKAEHGAAPRLDATIGNQGLPLIQIDMSV
jgi:hypothetical protein